MRTIRNKLVLAAVLLALVSAVPAAAAKPVRGNEFDAVCDFLEDRFEAKKVRIPFMWLARAAVGIVRPAGVKAFKVTIYRELKFSEGGPDGEMRSVMRDAFDEEWTPILRVIRKDGEQIYMNMREYKDNVKVLLVSINRNEAVVVRARFNPDKLAEFIENPEIFGIDLGGRDDDGDSGNAANEAEEN